MHAHPRAAAGQHHRVRADRFQRRTQRFALDRRAALGVHDQQTFGAPAAFGVDLAVRRVAVVVGVAVFADVMPMNIVAFVRRAQVRAQAHGARAAVDEFGDAFEQIDESLRAGIDHAGLLQQGHLLRRARQRAARLHQRAGEAAARIVAQPGRGFLHRIGEAVDHAQDGAFDRMGEGAAGAVGAMTHRRGQGLRVQCRLRAGVFGHAMQELREDRPGVAARAVDGVVADPLEQLADVPAAPAQRAVQHAAQGEGEVVAGVSIGHREDIDFIEAVAGGDDPARAGDQRPAQGRRGQGVRAVGRGRGLPAVRGGRIGLGVGGAGGVVHVASLPQLRWSRCCAAAGRRSPDGRSNTVTSAL